MSKEEAKKFIGEKVYSVKYKQIGKIFKVSSNYVWIRFYFAYWSLSHEFNELKLYDIIFLLVFFIHIVTL